MSQVTITATLTVAADGTVRTYGICEAGLPEEEDEDQPATPEGIVSSKVHDAIRETIRVHNEAVFNTTMR